MRVVVGISGGIAAYKAAIAIRQLVSGGHDVHVVPTTAALRFIGKPTLEALSRNPVTDEVFDDVAAVRHVALGQQAELIIVLPATANTIAKLAHGLSDDLLGTTVLASKAPLVIAPAMHTEMWQHPATQANIAILRDRGAFIAGPADGELTGGDTGPGRLVEPEEVVARALEFARQSNQGELTGKHYVISAGGTREPIDPVRFLANRSSGAFGVALARAAQEAGATVTLVGANLQVAIPEGVQYVPVETTAQLRAEMLERADADVVIMAAAVSDYRLQTTSDEKLTKERLGDAPVLQLAKNPDVLAELAKRERSGLVVGFAAETEQDDAALLQRGHDKLTRKGADALVVNRVGHDAGFGDVQTSVSVLAPGGRVIAEASGTKLSVARSILRAIQSM